MNEELFEQARTFLPKYLSPENQKQLFEELKGRRLPNKFYLDREQVGEALLQGDGWRGLVVLNFYTAERKSVAGVIVSNSCDIDPANARDFDPHVIFAPLLRLARYEALLREKGISEERISGTLGSIREQCVTSIFYFPADEELDESIVVLDDLHAHPLSSFMRAERQALFTLGQYAFYLFLIKLSIHFTRMQEGVHRFPRAAG